MMDYAMLIVSAVVGVAVVGIAAVTMDQASPNPSRDALKARMNSEYSKYGDMSRAGKMQWAYDMDKERRERLIRQQSLGEDYIGAKRFHDKALEEVKAQIASAKGSKPANERYSPNEDDVLRRRLMDARKDVAGYKNPEVDELIIARHDSLVKHRLVDANDDDNHIDNRQVAIDTAEGWDRDFDNRNAGNIQIAKTAVEATRAENERLSRQADFEARLAAIHEDYAQAHLEDLKQLRDTAVAGIDLSNHEERCRKMMQLLKEKIEAQLSLPDPAADDDIAREDHNVYVKYCGSLYPSCPAIADIKLNIVRTPHDLLTLLVDTFDTQKNVLDRITFLTDFDALLKRRAKARAELHIKHDYNKFKKNVLILLSLKNLYAEFATAPDHMKIAIVCTAEFVSEVHSLVGYVYPFDIAQMKTDVEALVTAEIAAISAEPILSKKIERGRVLLLRTKGKNIDLAALKTILSGALRPYWGEVKVAHNAMLTKSGILNSTRDIIKETLPEERDVLCTLFLEVRNLLTQYWGIPSITEFEHYDQISEATKNCIKKHVGMHDVAHDKATLAKQLSLTTSAFAQEAEVAMDVFLMQIDATWDANAQMVDKKSFFIREIIPQVYDIESELRPTIETSRLSLLLDMQADFAKATSNAAKIRFIKDHDVDKLVEFPEVYFPKYADAVIAAYGADSNQVINDVAAGNGKAALERYARLPPEVQRKLPARTRIDIDRMIILNGLIEEIKRARDPTIPATFYTHKSLELYSLYKTREHDWGLNIVDKFGLSDTILDDAVTWVRDMINKCTVMGTDKKANVSEILQTVRMAHDLIARADSMLAPGTLKFDALVMDVAGPGTDLQTAWAGVLSADDTDVPEDFSVRGKAFNAFANQHSLYWPNVGTLFSDFTVTRKKFAAVGDALVSLKKDTDLAEIAEFPYSERIHTAFATCTGDILECCDAHPKAVFMDLGRYNDTKDHDLKRYNKLESLIKEYHGPAAVDKDDIKAKVELLTRSAPENLGFV